MKDALSRLAVALVVGGLIAAIPPAAAAAGRVTLTTRYPAVAVAPGSKVTFEIGIRTDVSDRVDLSLEHGGLIPIEERDPQEVLGIEFEGERVAPIEAEARNIAFDVTPNRLITGIVTENGVVYPPFDVNLKKVVLG